MGELGNATVFSLMVLPFLYGIAVFVYMSIGAIAVIPVWIMSSGFREPVVTWLLVTAAIATVLFFCAATVVIDSTGPVGWGFGFSGTVQLRDRRSRSSQLREERLESPHESNRRAAPRGSHTALEGPAAGRRPAAYRPGNSGMGRGLGPAADYHLLARPRPAWASGYCQTCEIKAKVLQRATLKRGATATLPSMPSDRRICQ